MRHGGTATNALIIVVEALAAIGGFFDSEHGLAMTSGQTVLVNERGCEALSKRSLELVVR